MKSHIYANERISCLLQLSINATISPPIVAVQSLSITPAVGVAIACTTVVVFMGGVLVGIMLFYCISKHRSHSSKPEQSYYQQQQVVSSANPMQQTAPEYEEVIELRENKAYGPIEMRAN